MSPRYMLTLAMIVGAGLGAAGIRGLHAQAKPPVYVIQEIDVVSNPDAYVKEYVPKARALVEAFGGRSFATGSGKVITLEGEPPKSRVVVQEWESIEKIQTWLNSTENKELRKIADRYAKFRIFAVEGVPQ